MRRIIDGSRLKTLMDQQGRGPKALAREAEKIAPKCRVSVRTISRLRSGSYTGSVRPGTCDALAKVLGVEQGVLTGDLPMPAKEGASAIPVLPTQITVRLSADVRNALTLTAWRYKVPVTRIVELAALNFCLLAEASLAERRRQLGHLEAAQASAEALGEHFQHLPFEAVFNYDAQELIRSERKSINNRDVFAEHITVDGLSTWLGNYDPEAGNPFAAFLRKMAVDVSEHSPEQRVEVLGVGRHSVNYEVCQDFAHQISNGDEWLTSNILDGSVALHEMPRAYLEPGAEQARMAWLKEKAPASLIRELTAEELGI